MSPPVDPNDRATPAAQERTGDLRLGGWRLRPTAILTRQRQRIAQQCLLMPPAGFTGRARMAVIGEGRREEFSHLWEHGDEGSLSLGVAIDPEGRGQTRADLLLETDGVSPAAGGAAKFSGTLTLPRPPLGVQIYLAPLLAPPPALGPSPPNPRSREAGEGLRLLKSARRALERDRDLRAAWPESWSARIASLGWQQEIRAWCGEGRLELLSGGICEPPTRAALALPNLPQTYLLANGTRPWPAEDLAPGTRQILIPEDTVSSLPADDPSAEGAGRRPGLPFRLSLAGRWFLAHGYSPTADFTMVADADHPRAMLWFDRLIHHALHWRSRSPSTQHGSASGHRREDPGGARDALQTNTLGFSPLTVATVEQWKAIHKYTNRWNKGHLSPRLIAATPADYFAAVEALEEQGALRLREAHG
ncbi:MAG: hypothetical protein KAY32_05670 [Candidatus Eisenbacteria sp.]|nr:hypothetical protein [Candidatus Eisenbacteria bacterium]